MTRPFRPGRAAAFGPKPAFLAIVHFGLFQIGLYHPAARKARDRMEKTIYSREYAVVLRLLREAREKTGMTQVELAKKLKLTQSFVSKIERGDRRLDVVQ